MYLPVVVAAVAADDLRHDQLNRLSHFEHHGVLANSGEKVLCDIWNNWCCSDFPVPDVQTGVFRPNLRQ